MSQVLSLANLSLSSIEVSEDATRKKLDNILDLLGKAIGDVRNVSKTLDPENIKNRGLKSMVELELDLMSKSGRFKTDLEVRGEVVSLPVEKELVIYRMVQETLNNVIKHSDASVVRVIFEYTILGLAVQIHDNGVGFDTLAANDVPGMGAGLRNMRNRARLVGASLDISSLRHKGTSVTIHGGPLAMNPNMKKYRIALIDDHKLFRDGLSELIAAFQHFEVVLEADNGKDFIKKLDLSRIPDLVVLDINMKEMDGYETAAWLRQHHPQIKTLALSMYENETAVIRMIRAGADGYILKDVRKQELLTALNAIVREGTIFPKQLQVT